MAGIIDNLKAFNRKERFYLLGFALDNPSFTLGNKFRKAVNTKLNVNIPADAFVAMDYHIDWIYASILLSKEPSPANLYRNDGNIFATQEDIDLLIAYQEGKTCHIIMLEAKGDTAFNNNQFIHKMERIRSCFEKYGRKRWPGVVPYFGIVSPQKPRKLKYSSSPKWLLQNNEIPWIKMEMPEGKRITRCNKERIAYIDGKFWKPINIKKSI